jgi:hypothetical protein
MFRIRRPHNTLREKSSLNLGEFHGCGAFFVVIGYVIDPSAYGIAPHLASIVGFQHFARPAHIHHPRFEPQVAIASVEDDRHPVVDG